MRLLWEEGWTSAEVGVPACPGSRYWPLPSRVSASPTRTARGVDPAWELSKTMVVSGRMVYLARALAVFGVTAVLGLAASLFSDQALAVTFAWLVPITTVSAPALAAATWARNAKVGVGAGLMGWALIVVAAPRAWMT